MTQGRQLYRSRDALIAGVCAGVADYFSVDPLVVRILAAAFTLASGGLLGLAYLAMWIVVPKAPKIVKPLEVKPQSVHSDTYGTVDFGSRYGSTGQGPSRSNTPAQAAGWRYSVPSYTGAAHVPPEPPAAAPLKRVPQPVVHHPVDPPKEASESGRSSRFVAGLVFAVYRHRRDGGDVRSRYRVVAIRTALLCHLGNCGHGCSGNPGAACASSWRGLRAFA